MTFKKGDPRINRKGRPKSFDALRDLAVKIAQEPIKDGATVTVIEAMLRRMAAEDPTKFIEIAYGKVPNPIDITSGGKKIKTAIEIVYVNDWRTANPTDDDA